MQRFCHRCHADLPGEHSGSGSSAGDEERALFCSRCGAPQILLPSYMRAEPAAASDLGHTTGTVPPPRPHLVEWPVVLGCAAPVAVATAAFAIAAIFTAGGSFILTLCILCGSSIVLSLYRARRPLARIDGRVGLRVGALTGVLMIALTWTALSVTGVIERFGVHGMAGYDVFMTRQLQAVQAMTERILGSNLDPVAWQRQMQWMATPEYRAGSQILEVFMRSGIVLLLTTGLGAFAGMLQSRRRALPRS